MPAKRHPLRELVRGCIANNPTLGPQPLRDLLEDAARHEGIPIDKLPSPATIGRIKAEFPDDERQPYLLAYWPESFESGILPWAAAPSLLEYLGIALRHSERRRPTVRFAQLFWHVSSSVPDWTLDERFHLTVHMSKVTDPGLKTSTEEWLRAAEAAAAGIRGLPNARVTVHGSGPATIEMEDPNNGTQD